MTEEKKILSRQEIFNQLRKSLDETLISSIPSDYVKSLPPNYIYSIGVILCSIFLITWSIFFFIGYAAELKTKFLSLDQTSLKCDPVSIAVTGRLFVFMI
jgi:hypothetical protein